MVLPEIAAHRLPIICGPTGVGKTEVAVAVASRLGAEIVAADSRTVYRFMDIGTAKPTVQQRAQVPHHLIDVVDPNEIFALADYRRLALTAIEQIFARRQIPLLVGGTGLYIRAVTEGLILPAVPPDWELRERLEEQERRTPGALYQRLTTIDPIATTRIHPRNVRRLIRALEVFERTGRPITATQHQQSPPFATTQIGLTMDRSALYSRIDRRVDEQLAAGLLDEVKALMDRGYERPLPAMQGLGYKEMIAYLDGVVTFEEATRQLKRNTRRFAKRQYTWFRKDPRIRWVDITSRPLAVVVEHLLPMVE